MADFVRLETTLDELCTSGTIAGIVAMATSGSGPIWHGAFGKLAMGGEAAMTLDTQFWIASMTKAITSVAAMQLVERGLLQLDTPVSQWVPELASPQVLEGFDTQGKPVLRAAKGSVTLRQLLTHTSGLAYDIWNGDLKRWYRTTGAPSISGGTLTALQLPLMSDPGTVWEYGAGVDFAGRAVEAASGMRLEDYFREHIFVPLGMRDTSFLVAQSTKLRAAMHKRQPDGSLVAIPFQINQNPEFFSGGGGLYGTAPDYIRFARMVLNNGKSGRHEIIRPETLAQMTCNQIGALSTRPMRSDIPAASQNVDFFPAMVKKWGLGFLINTEQTLEGRSVGSLAWAGLSNCYYWIDPARDLAGVMLMQMVPFCDPPCLEAFRSFERAVYGR